MERTGSLPPARGIELQSCQGCLDAPMEESSDPRRELWAEEWEEPAAVRGARLPCESRH